MALDHMTLLFFAAWFVQMGVHEGAHAHMAYFLGDDTASLLGKRSLNPLAHIDWHDMNAVMLGVVAPAVSAWMGMVPMGMAWVPVNPIRLRRWRGGEGWVSAAGPVANLVLALLCLPVHVLLVVIGFDEQSMLRILDDFAYAIYITSLLYGLFNLVPIPPLDGSKVLRGVLGPWGQGVLDQLAPYGMLILIALFFVGPGSGLFSAPLGLAVTLWGVCGVSL